MNQSENGKIGWVSLKKISRLSIPVFCKANELSYPTFHS